jgi:adenylosuccinate synthase
MDPVFSGRSAAIEKLGGIESYLLISRKAHLILPTHRVLDAASEAATGVSKIVPPERNRPPYDKRANEIRVGDLERHDFMVRYHFSGTKHEDISAIRFFPTV